MSDESTQKISEKFEIQAYKRPRNIKDLFKTHVPCSGPPQTHPYESEKVIFIPDPFSTHLLYFIIKTENISFIEELPRLVDLARIFHESLPATVNMAILPRVLGCRTLRRTVQVRLGSNTLRLAGGTSIFTVSRQRFMRPQG